MHRRLTIFVALVWLAAAAVARAARAPVRVYATVEKNGVALREPFGFTIHAEGTNESPAPELPDLRAAGLEVVRGPSVGSRMSFVNGTTSVSVSATYHLRATRSGDLTIPPVAVRLAGNTYRTEPIAIRVSERAARSEPDLNDLFIAEIQVTPESPYVGQIVQLFQRIDVSSQLRVTRLSADLLPTPGFVEKPIDAEYRQRSVRRGAVVFTRYEKRSALIPIREGETTVGPFVARGSVPVRRRARDPFFGGFDSFFDDVFTEGEPVSAESAPLSIRVRALPAEGRPSIFSGAVGRYELKATASPSSVAAGDPVTLSVVIAGDGNLESVSMPPLPAISGARAYDPERQVDLEEGADTLRGSVTFKQAIVPSQPGTLAIPPIAFCYFDPDLGAYRTVDAGPFEISVSPGATERTGLVSASPGAPPGEIAILGKDLLPLKTSSARFAATGSTGGLDRATVALLLGLPALYLGGLVVRRRVDRLRADPKLARSLRAARAARERIAEIRQSADRPGADVPGEVSRALAQYLGDKLGVPAPSLIGPEVRERLAARGIDAALAAEVAGCLEACDRARYGMASASNGVALVDQAERLIASVEEVA